MLLPVASYGQNERLGYGSDTVSLLFGIGVGYDSNLYDSQTVKESSHYYAPSFEVEVGNNSQILGFVAGYNYNSFIPDNMSDTAHQNIVSLASFWSPLEKSTFSFDVQLEHSDERRGEGLTEGAPLSISNLDHYFGQEIELSYDYKVAKTNSLFLNLGYGEDSKQYESKKTDALDANLEQSNSSIAIGYILSEGKQLFVEKNTTSYDYPDASSTSKNSENDIIYAGIDWSFSESSKLNLAVGNDEKVFDSSGEKRNTDYWQASFYWSPLSHTQFVLETENEQKPATKADQTFNEVNSLSFSWSHVWSIDYTTVLDIEKKETRSIVSNNENIDKDLEISLKTIYKDLEFSLVLEENIDGATSDKLSQFEVQVAYYFKGGL